MPSRLTSWLRPHLPTYPASSHPALYGIWPELLLQVAKLSMLALRLVDSTKAEASQFCYCLSSIELLELAFKSNLWLKVQSHLIPKT